MGTDFVSTPPLDAPSKVSIAPCELDRLHASDRAWRQVVKKVTQHQSPVFTQNPTKSVMDCVLLEIDRLHDIAKWHDRDKAAMANRGMT